MNQDQLLSKIEKVFINQGLSLFSSRIAVQYLKNVLSNDSDKEDWKRVIGYILNLINNKIISYDNITDLQSECTERIPYLTSKSIWYSINVSTNNEILLIWINLLESSYSIIKQEFLNARKYNIPLFQPYRSPDSKSNNKNTIVSSGNWNICYLQLHGIDFNDNLNAFPETAKILNSLPRIHSHSFFSVLTPSTHITPHFGPTNKKLRFHLPLIIPDDKLSWLRVGNDTIQLIEGKCIVFDDSFEHEAGNDSINDIRAVLVVDIWHPELSDSEIKFLTFVSKSLLVTAKKLSNKLSSEEENDGSDFYTLILKTRNQAFNISRQDIWGRNVIDD